MTTRRITFDQLPLFASEQEIGAALLGPERWKASA